jgi:hypothetical protein
MPVTALALLLAPLLSAGAVERKASAPVLVLPAVKAGSATGPQFNTSLTIPAGIGAQPGVTIPQLAASAPSYQGAAAFTGAASAKTAKAAAFAASANDGSNRLTQAKADGARLKAGAAQPAQNNLPPSAQAENTARIVETLTQTPAAQLSGEDAYQLAGRLIEPRGAFGGLDVAASAPGGRGIPAASLAPWQRDAYGAGPHDHGVAGQASFAAGPQKPSWRERLHYRRLWAENLWFYLYTNIVNKWGQYAGDHARLKAAGITPPVSKPRKFFSHMRVMGQTGEFYVPGFTPRHDADVLSEARETFMKYFDGPGITDAHRRAFEGFLQRAMAYNVERRAASKFRANVRDNMLKASVMDPAKMVAFFDGLPIITRTAEFQAGAADKILEQFRQVVMEELAKEPKDAPDRITGIILIGSFALGAATPTSDFDVEPLTADGGSGRVKGFSQRLTARWAEVGRQKTNPVTFHMFGYLNSRWELQKIHHEPYIIISPDQAIIANLAMRPGEPNDHIPSRDLKPVRGSFLRWAQYAAVYLTSLFTRAK